MCDESVYFTDKNCTVFSFCISFLFVALNNGKKPKINTRTIFCLLEEGKMDKGDHSSFNDRSSNSSIFFSLTSMHLFPLPNRLLRGPSVEHCCITKLLAHTNVSIVQPIFSHQTSNLIRGVDGRLSGVPLTVLSKKK
eukprot:TRINITY_DN8020_c0_g4_i1.p1 TRINITY_DN8020_c0_g4~~TRINITY_DN8020_c0_g4_i1.p1  ORF type:complete len:137 (+),score=12.83 TRINITY_DN8020_c0_g4_i1:98-508(+)